MSWARFEFRQTKTKLIWSKTECVSDLFTPKREGGGGGGGGGGRGQGANPPICTEIRLLACFL